MSSYINHVEMPSLVVQYADAIDALAMEMLPNDSRRPLTTHTGIKNAVICGVAARGVDMADAAE